MPRPEELPAGEPLGFPRRCQRCPYVRVGPARICTACASRALEQIVPQACPMGSQMLDDGGYCPNWLCDDDGRRIERIDAIAYLSGELRVRIHRYKYEGRTYWSVVFGRLLLGWLEANALDNRPDLIIANPNIWNRAQRAWGMWRGSSYRRRTKTSWKSADSKAGVPACFPGEQSHGEISPCDSSPSRVDMQRAGGCELPARHCPSPGLRRLSPERHPPVRASRCAEQLG
jgi:hypothetical protein